MIPALGDVAAVASEAAKMALSRIGGDYRRWDKEPGHPVSDVDLAVDAFLRPRLETLAPDAAWLSEETADDGTRLGARRVWIVDPIDGTRDYLRGRSGWCVSVALVEAGAPVLGVLAAPMRGELWTATRGQGARLNGECLRASMRTDLPGARVPIDVLARIDRDLVAVAKPNSIALRVALVAADRADLVVTAKGGHEWDIAAAALIATEAGAAITDGRGVPLRFNTLQAEVWGVLASAPGIHAAAVLRFGGR